MTEKPLLSVIVPCYNVEQYVDRCLKSLVSQTYDNLEIICIDDGSKDKTPSMLDSWATNDTRIRIIHQENKGLPKTRLVGIQVIRGVFNIR